MRPDGLAGHFRNRLEFFITDYYGVKTIRIATNFYFPPIGLQCACTGRAQFNKCATFDKGLIYVVGDGFIRIVVAEICRK